VPLTSKGVEILSNMRKEYGEHAGTRIFYQSRNAGTITGVDAQPGDIPSEMLAEPEAVRAAGVLCVAKDGCVLMMRRADSGLWALPGGHIEDGESAEQAARRELYEETGYSHVGELKPWTRRLRDNVDFTTFLAHVEEFCPTLDQEHTASHWVDREFAAAAMGLLHPGVSITLVRFSMDELGIAKAIRDGELTSPQRYGNLLLIAIRITGTGASYRSALNEYVWRDPSIYMNPEFLERCNGLPVIVDHPEKAVLNTEEFRNRIVGTVFLPYLREPDEVWGIAKILDMEAAEDLETKPLSTSPAVVFTPADGNVKHEMKNGSILLIEGKPSLLDHLAICVKGVWDKGGDPAGVESIDARPDATSASKLGAILHELKMHELVRIADRR
jgi:8-oxo-dGTP pyrophosphatase MutT (NUDIX family)